MPSMPTKIDLKPKRKHGFSLVIFIFGTLFPPIAVAIRFGIGSDFWLNLVLTLCGYIPGHVHNFYIQNIRNNSRRNRTPKWAARYGLVDTSAQERRQKKSQWAGRYSERLPQSTLREQSLEEGQEGSSSVDISSEGAQDTARPTNGDLWRPTDESYYNADAASQTPSGSGRWHYPANFDDTIPDGPQVSSGGKKKKKDRFARTEDAYSYTEERPKRKKSKKKKKDRSDTFNDTASRRSEDGPEFPEDPAGGLYRDHNAQEGEHQRTTDDDVFNHQF